MNIAFLVLKENATVNTRTSSADGFCKAPGGLRCTAVVILVTSLLMHSTLLLWMAWRDSTTWDEVGHLAAGLQHWYYGQFSSYSVNPPLVRLIACAPLALWNRDLDVDSHERRADRSYRPEFANGQHLAQTSGVRYFSLTSIARSAAIPFSILGAVVCFLWAREMYGGRAAILASSLWLFSPSVLAYGHLITPDVGAAALGAAANYVFWKWLKTPRWVLAVSAGLVLGLAELTKTTWVVLFLMWPLLWVLCRRRSLDGERKRCWRRESAQIGCMLVLAIWVLNIGYGFEGFLKPFGEYRFFSAALKGTSEGLVGNRFADSWIGHIPVPVPKNYVFGIDYVKMEYENKYWSYMRGEWRLGGWWYYYIYALLIKEPLGTWILLLLAVRASFLRGAGYSVALREEIALLFPAVIVLVLVSSQTGFNHHVRYVLPCLPFLFIWISKVARSLDLGHRMVAAVVVLALGWSIVSSLSVFPHSLSYFNELAGGPKKGHWHLSNSNTDWGQDLLYLKKWYEMNPRARPLFLAYDLPLIDPKMLGIDWRKPPIDAISYDAGKDPYEVGPTPGWYATSVNEHHNGRKKYEYLKDMKPVDWVGYTLPIYHLTLEEANTLRRKYGLPELPRPATTRPTTQPVGSQVNADQQKTGEPSLLRGSDE